MGKRAEGVSIIGGADGPTSIFLVGNRGKKKLKNRIRSFWYERKRERAKKKIVANPHTLKEVARFLKQRYGAVELSKDSRIYREQERSLKEALICRYHPELLGELANIEAPLKKIYKRKEKASSKQKSHEREIFEKKALEEFWKKLEQRSQRAEEIPADVFPIDYHLYEIRIPGGGRVQTGIETIWKSLEVSWSGNKKCRKKLNRISRSIYWYYGVSEEDIQKKTERYGSLVTALCTK